MRAIGAVLGVALFWAGAALANDPQVQAPQPSQAPPSRPAIPQSVWRVGADGSAEHLQSGWVCPAAIDGFTQGVLHVYDGFGLDVSCDFRSPGALLTLYITRVSAGFDPAANYASGKDAVLKGNVQRHPTLLSEDQPQMGGFKWSRATYAEDVGLHSELWLTMLRPDWYFEFRATYPADQEAAVNAALAKLAVLTARSAGDRLKLCAGRPAPVRSGVLVVDPKTVSDQAMMSSLLGGAAQIQVQNKAPKAGEVQPVIWCAETPSQQDRISLLFWRGIHPDGSDARIDRVTGMTMGPPPVLEIGFDDLANDVEQANAKGARPPERWTAETHDGDQTWIYGYFDGRPGPDVAGPFFAGVLQGKTRSIGGYSAKGSTININMPPASKP